MFTNNGHFLYTLYTEERKKHIKILVIIQILAIFVCVKLTIACDFNTIAVAVYVKTRP